MNNRERSGLHLPYWTQDDPATTLATPRLTDEVYAASSSSYVLLCVEIMLVDFQRDLAYLPWRQRKPCVGWWYFGGRILRGESEYQAAQRVLAREADLKFDLNQFRYLRQHRLICNEREEIPQDAGADYLSFQFAVPVGPVEVRAAELHLDSREFDSSKGLLEVTRGDMVRLGVHHSIISLYEIACRL